MMGYRIQLTWTALAAILLLALIIAPVAADSMTREDGTDHDGNDYQTLFPGSSMYNGTAPGCAEACLNDAVCNACTFNPRDQSCWLKEVVPAASARPGVTSYVKVRGEGQAIPAATVAKATQAERPPEEPTPTKSPGFEAFATVIAAAGVLALRKT